MIQVSSAQFASNASWKFIDFIVRKVVGLVISIILARLIAPEAYGAIALTLVFITFSDIFIINGFNVALIRKEKASEIDYSTVMAMSLSFTIIMYVVFFFSAPYFASFYNIPKLCPVLRVITILLFFEAVASVVRAKGTRELKFKKMAVSSCISNITAGLIAIVFAYRGWGVWALVAQQLIANFLDMVVIIVLFRWKFSLHFSPQVAKSMLKFTTGVLSTSFLDFLGNNVCSLIIGKSYSTKYLGYYNRANMFPEIVGLNVFNSINSVLLPTLTSRQNDNEEMKRIVRKVMSFTAYLILPMMLGLIGVAKILIPVLLTEKWAPSISLMYFCCIYYAVNPIRAIGYSVFYAKGISGYSVRIEIVRSFLMISGILVVVFAFKGALLWVLFSNVIVSFVVAFASQKMLKSCIGYSYLELLADILPSLIMSLIMMTVVIFIGQIQINMVSLLAIQIVTGVSLYWLMSILTNNENYYKAQGYMKSLITRYFNYD